MNVEQSQARVDRIPWYHEFDFGGGVRARSSAPPEMVAGHRRVWAFIERELDAIDFRGKTVLDIGCWDGYWSFYAERRGARAVLATDDFSQNWSSADGITLAKELLGSKVEIVRDQSIYNLKRLGRTFDVVLCLGVFYHLWDPFVGFAEVRHCCHPGSVVAIEGNVSYGMPPHSAYFTARYPHSRYTPTCEALDEMLRATYLTPVRTALLDPPPAPVAPQRAPESNERVGWRWRMEMARAALRGSRPAIRAAANVLFPEPAPSTPAPAPEPKPDSRVFVRCDPLNGANPLHDYAPPFGLHQFDPRYRAAARAA